MAAAPRPWHECAMTLFMDRALATRLERTEGAINAAFVEAHGRLSPELGASFREVAGTYLMFDGADSPLTQAFGLGLTERVSPGDLAAMEAFFRSRGAPVHHEVSPLSGMETFGLLAERGYKPLELTTILVQALSAASPNDVPSGFTVRPARPEEAATWIETSVAGWSEFEASAEYIRTIARVSFANPATVSFLAFHDGQPVATGALGIHEGVALLAGASTVREKRGLGAQQALLAARITEAKRRGCDLAMMGAEPGSTSQRNAERNGFRVAYTRMKWRLALGDMDAS